MSSHTSSEQKVTEIRLSESVGKRVWLAWTGAILLPTLFLWWFLARTVVEEEQSLRGKTETSLVSSMNRFLDDLQPERFLDHAMKKVDARAGFPALGNSHLHLTASQSHTLISSDRFLSFLKRAITRQTGAQPLILITFGPDISSVRFEGNPAFFHSLNTPSPRSLRLLAEQWLEGGRRRHSKAPTNRSLEATKGAYPGNSSRNQDFARHVVKNFLGEYAPLTPEIGRPEGFFCNRFGCGQLWLYLRPITAGNAPDAPILGGFIAILRDADIDRESILDFATGMGNRNLLRRQTFPIPQLIEERDRLSYVFPLPAPLQKPAERAPATAASGLHPSPTLAITAPNSQLHHPWRRWFASALVFSLVWLALTFSLFRRLSSRRPSPALLLQEKLMIALGFAIIPPLLVLILLTTSLMENGREEMRRTLKGHLKQRLSMIESGLSEFISEQNLNLLRKRDSLVAHLFAPPDQLSKQLHNFFSGYEFISALLVRHDGVECSLEKVIPGVPEIPAKVHDRLLEMARLQAIRLYAETQPPEQYRHWFKQGMPGIWKKDRRIMADYMWKRDEMGPILGKDIFTVDPSFSGFSEGSLRVIALNNDAGIASAGTALGFIFVLQPYLALGNAYFSRLFSPGFTREFEYPGYELQAAVFARSVKSEAERRLLVSASWPQQAKENHLLIDTARAGLANPWSHDQEESGEDIREFQLFHSFPFIAVISAREKLHPLKKLLPAILFCLVTLYFLLLIRFSARLLSRSLVAPMHHLAEVSRQVSHGQIPSSVALPGSGEFAQLAEDLHRMCKGLREGRLLSRFVSSDAQQEIAAGTRSRFEPGGELRNTAILFSKIVGFHELVVREGSDKAIALLNRYFSCMEPAVSRGGGTIDKYIGDAIMAVFHGTPDVSPARQAVMAAAFMRKELGHFRQELKVDSLSSLVTGIGIATGPVISGRIGSKLHRMDFTVIGDVVNTAARIESRRSLAHQDSVLMDKETAASATGLGEITLLGQLELKGKTKPIELFELKTEVPP